MARSIYIIIFLSICLSHSIAQKKEYDDLFIGKWELDSAIDITKTKKKLRREPGYTISFEKSGCFTTGSANHSDSAKIKTLLNFKSATWKIISNDTLVISAIYTPTEDYIKKSGTKDKTMAINSKSKILYIDEFMLTLEDQIDSPLFKKSIAFYSRTK